MSLHNLFQGSSDGVDWEAEFGVAAAEGQFSPTGAPDLSRLAIDSNWCPQQEIVVVVHCVRSEAKLAWDNHGMRQRFFSGHGCFVCAALHKIFHSDTQFGSLYPMTVEGQLQALSAT